MGEACIEGCRNGADAAVNAACKGEDDASSGGKEDAAAAAGAGGEGSTVHKCFDGLGVCPSVCGPLQRIVPYPKALNLCLKSCKDGVSAICHQKFHVFE